MNNTDKLDLTTPDLVSQNIDKIATLFPNCITETAEGKAVDFDLLKQELNHQVVEGTKERYRLEWPGKKEAIVTANLPTTKTLRPVPEDSMHKDGTPFKKGEKFYASPSGKRNGDTENLYIEGDNLEVLKILQESYLGKIKMIYIDPPYNTGNDFVYKDNFTQDSTTFKEESGQIDQYGNRLVANPEAAGRYHSNWLSMMYPRLKLARNLLTDDGVIFMSIDDNEVHNLRKIGDEIFGESNFVIEIAWRKSDNQANIGNIARVKEYIICFAKNIINLNLDRLPLSEKAKKEYRYSDDEGYFRRAILLHKTRGRHYYDVETRSGHILKGPWMIKEKEFKQLDEENGIYWTSGGEEQPYGKIYLHKSKGQIPNDFWGIEFGTNQRGSKDVENLFNKRVFDFPKSTKMLSNIVKIGSNTNNIILDFFSGSASTAQAILQQNSEDGGNRKYIMVQLPEATDLKSEAFKAGYKNICEIGKERIRRAGNKIIKELEATIGEKKQQLEKLANSGLLIKDEQKIETLKTEIANLQTKIANLDIGFKVFKADTSNMQEVYYKPQDYKQGQLDVFADNIKEDRSTEDLLTQVLLDWGLPLTLKTEILNIQGKEVFKIAENSLMACFSEGVDEAFAKEVATHQPLRIVFKDSAFKDDTAKENVKQLLKQLSPNTEMKVI